MNTIACVYWKGKFRGREKVYSPEWVYRLKGMVSRNIIPGEAHRFVCLTNVPEEFDESIETISLAYDLPGWWSKMELFRPDVFSPGERVLYLDLDLLILRNLQSFFDYDSQFALIGTGKRKLQSQHNKKVIRRYNSSVMVFTMTERLTKTFFDPFINSNKINKYRGDQDWIASRDNHLKTFPNAWIKKLKVCKNGKPLPGMKIMLCMDGDRMSKKNITAIERYKWMREVWTETV